MSPGLTREIIISYIIIFCACLILGSILGIYLVWIGKYGIEIFTIILPSAGAGALAICTGLNQAIKQVQGVCCEYGTAPECVPYKKALQAGFIPNWTESTDKHK